jgi:hypothetical protein
VAEAVECLPGKHQDLIETLVLPKKKKKRKKERKYYIQIEKI